MPNPRRKYVVAIDFDGTLVTLLPTGSYPKCGKWLKNARRFLRWLGYQPSIERVLWTCRIGPALDVALDYMEKDGFGRDWWHGVNESAPSVGKWMTHCSRKIFANMYIDDRGFGSGAGAFGFNFPHVVEHIIADMESEKIPVKAVPLPWHPYNDPEEDRQ